MCLCQDSSLLNVTPRCLWWLTKERGVSLKIRLRLLRRVRDRKRASVFAGLKLISHCFDHKLSSFKCLLIVALMWVMSLEDITRELSSAKSLVTLCNKSAISLTYNFIRNKRGPKTALEAHQLSTVKGMKNRSLQKLFVLCCLSNY